MCYPVDSWEQLFPTKTLLRRIAVTNTTEKSDLLAGREQTYAFLASVFRDAPSGPVILDLTKALSGGGGEDDSPGYSRLRRWSAHVSESALPSIERELATEYARCVLNTGQIPCYYPCESVYTSPEGMMKQEAYHQVVAIYAAEGLGRARRTGEPEDHISAEMEYMAHLCSRARDALTGGCPDLYAAYLDKQRAFLEEHLLVWAPRYAGNMKTVARGDFYLAVAEITEEFLADELVNLEDLAVSGD